MTTTMNMKRAAFGLADDPTIPSIALDEEGTFVAIVACFNNIDGGNDRILPGAFRKSLDAWKASGDPIPCVFAHQWASPDAHIGYAYPEDVKEVPKGLLVKAHLDVGDNPVAARIWKLLVARRMTEFSIGYGLGPGGERPAADRSGANELVEIDLYEFGPTLKGMNNQTELLSIKSVLGIRDEGPQQRRDAEPDHHPQRLHPRPSQTTEGQLRQRAEAAGLVLPWTERELRKASDEAHTAHVAVPSRALRRRSDEQRLEAAIGGRQLPPTERQRRKRADRADAAEAYAREYSAMHAVLTERADTADTSKLRRKLKALLTDG